LNPCVPALMMIVGVGITKLKLVPRTMLAGAIVGLSVFGVLSYYKKDFDLTRGNWRAISSFILDRTQPGDDLYYVTFSGAPLEYYKMVRHRDSPRSIVPDKYLLLRASVGEALSNSRVPGTRVWLVLTGEGEINKMLRAYFSRGRHVLEEHSFDSVTVILLGNA
jgi:hypothetical protein